MTIATGAAAGITIGATTGVMTGEDPGGAGNPPRPAAWVEGPIGGRLPLGETA